MIKSFLKKHEIVRFMVVGGSAAGIHYLIYIALLSQTKEYSYNLPYIAGFVISLICNFYGSNYFTFNTKPTLKRAIKFGLSHGINFFNQMLLLNVFVWLGVHIKIVPVLVFTIAFPLNFILVRYSLKGLIVKNKTELQDTTEIDDEIT
ncbi:MAG: GtrA family protein, partial [Rikenellaceae bacterium]